ncbi:formylglycine-generating enzyme family protein [Vibrio sp. ZSDE26]|uniref:Formylglycine-generating enzyme family protein n=1 Tax=Vibrio amylolyticus TaxID=2847292 RepID=A0A9X1XRG9_9VIBR|nr:SUMF1/EgtB/PvdO family nonheme iron enzyme [Vibrio amylolyticus]MCK6265795.1 formylglycine-generating enzyme family protein [Vibrio amylolyticus]
MKNKWLTAIALAPAIGACSDTNWANKLSSDSVSQEQIKTISNNIEKLYPDASDELKYKAADVAVRAIENLVFVEGGSFEMGDFGMPCEVPSGTVNRIDWTPDVECLSSPTSVETGAVYLHDVTLDSYSMSAYETSFSDMEWMRQINGLPVAYNSYDQPNADINRNSSTYHELIDNSSNLIAWTKKWQEAKDYCLWLGEVTTLPFDLPTEAQWEYAARSEGKKNYYATNNGYLQFDGDSYIIPESGIYIEIKREEANAPVSLSAAIGKYPPTPLGIYDMSNLIREWVNDWYSPNYYQVSPKYNPLGPEDGTLKVVRGGANTMTFDRSYEPPKLERYSVISFRCSSQTEI